MNVKNVYTANPKWKQAFPTHDCKLSFQSQTPAIPLRIAIDRRAGEKKNNKSNSLFLLHLTFPIPPSSSFGYTGRHVSAISTPVEFTSRGGISQGIYVSPYARVALFTIRPVIRLRAPLCFTRKYSWDPIPVRGLG